MINDTFLFLFKVTSIRAILFMVNKLNKILCLGVAVCVSPTDNAHQTKVFIFAIGVGLFVVEDRSAVLESRQDVQGTLERPHSAV